jgi:hypothetical protein
MAVYWVDRLSTYTSLPGTDKTEYMNRFYLRWEHNADEGLNGL